MNNCLNFKDHRQISLKGGPPDVGYVMFLCTLAPCIWYTATNIQRGYRSGIFYRVSCPTESGGLRVGDHNSCSEAVGLWRQKVTL